MASKTDAALEYTKSKNLNREDVQTLLDWAHKQPHLPKITELQAIIFLHSCYNRNEAAKTTLDNFFTMKTHCPELFGSKNPFENPLKYAMEVCVMAALSHRTLDGKRIFLYKLVDTNPDNYNFADQIRVYDSMLMVHLNTHGTSEGHIIVFDMEGISFGYFFKLSPLIMKKLLYYLQDAMPVRLKGLHFVNIVPFMDKVLALMKPFMKKELLDLMFLHNTVEELCRSVPRECLPRDYGGENESLADLHEKMKRDLRDNADFLKWDENLKVDESKRSEKNKSFGETFGVEGSFKKLQID